MLCPEVGPHTLLFFFLQAVVSRPEALQPHMVNLEAGSAWPSTSRAGWPRSRTPPCCAPAPRTPPSRYTHRPPLSPAFKGAFLKRMPSEPNSTVRRNLSCVYSTVQYSMRLHLLPLPCQAVLKLEPRVVTLVEWDCNQNQAFFLPRYRETLDFFAGIFSAHEQLAPRSSFGRRGFEERVLAREMTNLVACEGLQRMVRAEPLGQLGTRMLRMGFAPLRFTERTEGALLRMLKAYPRGFNLVDHPLNGCFLRWHGSSILGASSWQPQHH